MIKALLIEDEPLAARKLQRLLADVAPDINVLEVIDSVEAGIRWLRANPAPDVIFSDIQLADGNSFEIYAAVKISTPIIFTTAYDSYALKSFELNSIDYLLKPINPSALNRALQKFRLGHTQSVAQVDYAKLLEMLAKHPAEGYKKRFVIQVGERIKTIETEDVAYFKADGRYVYLTTSKGESLIVNYTLEELEGMLDPAVFFRANRKFIISIKAVTGMLVLSKSKIRIELQPACNEECVVSSERSSEYKEWLNK